MVVLLDLDAHLGHGGEHLGAHVLHRVLGRHREVAHLGADAVAEIAALVFGPRIDRQLDLVDLEAGVVGLGRVAHVVEHEELGLGAERDGVADPRRLDHALGLLGDAAGIAVVGLPGGGLEHVAHQHQGGLGEERIDAGRTRIRHQAHVELVDRLPAGDRGAVEHLALRKRLLGDHRDVEGHVLPLAARIGEPEIRILNVIVLDQLQDVMGRRHWVGFPGWKKRTARHCRAG